jgi:hypothetical protein
LPKSVNDYEMGIVYLAISQGVFKSTDSGATWLEIRAGGSLTITVDPFQSSHLLAELTGNGLFESHDGGSTWTAVTNLPPIPNGGDAIITGISFHSKVQGTIFLSVQGTGKIGVLRSTDGGATYTITNNGLANTQTISVVAPNPQTPTMLFVGTAGGLFKSVDNGDSWALSNAARASVISFDANVAPPTVYIDDAKSTDLGVTWTSIPDAGAIVADPSAPNSIFAIGTNGPQWSPDGGTTFFPLTTGIGQSNIFLGFGGQGLASRLANLKFCFLEVSRILYCGFSWGRRQELLFVCQSDVQTERRVAFGAKHQTLP